MDSKSAQSFQVLCDNDPTSANTSQELTGYGDISQSEINFLPSLPSEIVIERAPSYRRNAKRPLPPTICKNMTTESEEFDGLSALLDNLRTERENSMSQGREPSQPSVKAGIEQPKFTTRRIPAPLQINNFNGAHRVSANPPSRVSPARPFRVMRHCLEGLLYPGGTCLIQTCISKGNSTKYVPRIVVNTNE